MEIENLSKQEIMALRAELWAKLEVLGDPRTIERPEDNVILDCDSYKLAHAAMFKRMKVTGAAAYIEPRLRDKRAEIVQFGLQMYLKRFRPITLKMIDEAEEFFKAHIIDGEKLFPREDWVKVVTKYHGYPPLIIRAIPEGTVVPSQNALVSIECYDEDLAWMAAYFEDQILRAVWYPVTVATKSRAIRQLLKKYAAETSDLPVNEVVAFQFHDFGARGASSKETAGIGGAAHLATGAMGSDTITGVRFMNTYYKAVMSAFSVFATEHSIMTMRGPEGQLKTVQELIEEYATRPGQIVSIVSDGYDLFGLALDYCTTLKPLIEAKEIRLVVRPDSGNAIANIKKLLVMFEKHFGVVVNSKGYKVLNTVRILQGDGLSTVESFDEILEAIKLLGFSSENLVFGMGGGLLQMVNRDDLKFAMKTCAALLEGKWTDVFKDPITDPGKRSKRGILTVIKNIKTNEIKTIRVSELTDKNIFTDDHVELMETIWHTGEFFKEFTCDEVRASSNQDCLKQAA